MKTAFILKIFPAINGQGLNPEKLPQCDGEVSGNEQGLRQEDINVVYQQVIVETDFIKMRFAQPHGRVYLAFASSGCRIAVFNQIDGTTVFQDKSPGGGGECNLKFSHQNTSLRRKIICCYCTVITLKKECFLEIGVG